MDKHTLNPVPNGTSENSYIHLHVMSDYSIGESAARIPQLIEKAESLHMKALALTDKTLAGALPFYQHCLKHDIKPIIGQKILHGDAELILLCKDFEAYTILCKHSLEIQKHDGTRLALPLSKEECKHFICITQDYDFPYLQESFGADLYAEIVFSKIKGDETYCKNILPLLEKMQAVITNPVCFINKEDYDVLNAIRKDKALHISDCDPDNYFAAEQEIKPFLENINQLDLLENTRRIAEKIDYIFPEDWFDTVKCIQRMSENLPLPPECNGTISAADFLRNKVEENLSSRFDAITIEIRERINYEMDNITSRGFEKFILLHWKISEECKKKNIAYGPGRGSSSSSLVSYVLGITGVNPLEYNLLYERFLNPERLSCPDFDIDFDYEKVDDVVQILKDCFGNDNVSRTVTYVVIKVKQAIQIAGKALNLPDKKISFITELFSAYPRYTLDKILSNLKEVRKNKYKWAFDSYDEVIRLKDILSNIEYEKLITLAKKLEGLIHNSCVHGCAYIITKEPVNNYLPVLFDEQKGIQCSQCDMPQLESYGIYKTDIIGLKALTKIRKTVELIEAKTGKTIDISSIPLDDEKTLSLFEKGKTEGVFQFQSPGMQQQLSELKPDSFCDIAALNAMYRPGLVDYIPEFIGGKHKTNNHESILFNDWSSIIDETYGVIVYQEQVMQIVSRITGCTLGEADLFRRAMGKRKFAILRQKEEEFVSRAQENGISAENAAEMFLVLIPYAGYGFNKSHIIPYTKLAWQDAYLKAHFPEEHGEVSKEEEFIV